MNKVNTIVFCKDDYDNEQQWRDAVRDALFILMDAQYQAVIRYDEQSFGIIRVDFESSNESHGAPWPYWLTPTEAERVITDDELCNEDNTETNEQNITTVPLGYNNPVTEETKQLFYEYWAPLVMNGDGTVNLGALMNELVDFKFMIDQVPEVYSEVTGGQLSKPLYPAKVVIDAFDEEFGSLARSARLLEDDWDMITEDCKSNTEYKRAVLEYLGI